MVIKSGFRTENQELWLSLGLSGAGAGNPNPGLLITSPRRPIPAGAMMLRLVPRCQARQAFSPGIILAGAGSFRLIPWVP